MSSSEGSTSDDGMENERDALGTYIKAPQIAAKSICLRRTTPNGDFNSCRQNNQRSLKSVQVYSGSPASSNSASGVNRAVKTVVPLADSSTSLLREVVSFLPDGRLSSDRPSSVPHNLTISRLSRTSQPPERDSFINPRFKKSRDRDENPSFPPESSPATFSQSSSRSSSDILAGLKFKRTRPDHPASLPEHSNPAWLSQVNNANSSALDSLNSKRSRNDHEPTSLGQSSKSISSPTTPGSALASLKFNKSPTSRPFLGYSKTPSLSQVSPRGHYGTNAARHQPFQRGGRPMPPPTFETPNSRFAHSGRNNSHTTLRNVSNATPSSSTPPTPQMRPRSSAAQNYVIGQYKGSRHINSTSVRFASRGTAPDASPVKSMSPLRPLWLRQGFSANSGPFGRPRGDARMTSSSPAISAHSRAKPDPRRKRTRLVDLVPEAHIVHDLKLIVAGREEEEDEEEVREGSDNNDELVDDLVPPVLQNPVAMPRMAARKRKYYDKHQDAPVHVPSEFEIPTESSEESSPETSEVDELDSSDESPDTRSVSGDATAKLPDELLIALEALALPVMRMQDTRQLPFLLRNVRRGFQYRCRLVGVPTLDVTPPRSISVLFAHRSHAQSEVQGAEEEFTFEMMMREWRCPMCDIHGQFKSQAMLKKHLEWDHSEVKSSWKQIEEQAWMIVLNIPKPREANDTLSSSSKTQPTGRFHPSQQPPEGLEDSHSVNVSWTSHEPSTTLSAEGSMEPHTTISTGSSISRQTTPSLAKLKRQSLSPPPPPSSSVVSSQSRTSREHSTTTTRSNFSWPTLYPTPPPLSKPLGPAAQYPYLPAQFTNGDMLHYSCRPGGPRVYDLLGTLPMERFGTLGWTVIDREEDIFEPDDVRDEDKVIQALWSRWIVLNRNQFIRDHYLGTVAFVDEYWRMIYEGAGWSALKHWLLMLVVNHFLTGSEIVKILRHYEGLTGM